MFISQKQLCSGSLHQQTKALALQGTSHSTHKSVYITKGQNQAVRYKQVATQGARTNLSPDSQCITPPESQQDARCPTS